MRRLLLLGLNHQTAPVEVRERVAFGGAQQRRAIECFRHRYPETELVLLSTCNRVELYLSRSVHGHPRAEELIGFLAEFHQVPADLFRSVLYEKAERDAVEHLFSVAASLDSMVLGETQILGQVRGAYELAAELGSAGTALHPLFQRALAVGKQVMHETPLAEGRTSVASVAVDYARRIFATFADKSLLCVGAGKMTALVLQSFVTLHPKQIRVCNRDLEKGALLAGRFGGSAVPFDSLPQHLASADIVITSTGAPHPIITKRQVESILRQRRYRPIFLIDLAVPRDVESAAGELENVYLFNLDDLQRVVQTTQAQRGGAVESARQIVTRHVTDFLASQRQRELGPIIDRLYKRFHEMAREEVQRTVGKLPNAGDAEKQHLEDLARRIVNKLLHDPIRSIRDNDPQHASGAAYLHAVEKLFHLNAEDDGPGDPLK